MCNYDHGDDRYRYPGYKIVADFSSNVPDVPSQDALWKYLVARRDVIRHYPDPHPYALESSLSRILSVDKRCVAVTSGATDAIYLIAHLFQNHSSVICHPTFSEYASACRLFCHSVTSLFADDTSPFIDLPKQTQVVWLCNPNNPTGHTCDRNALLWWINANPQVTFVVDQSYHAFTSKPVLSPQEVVKLPNCILIQSLTKSYAIPGLRLGYMVANSDILSSLSRFRMPWSVNALAIEAGLYLVQQPLPFSLDTLLQMREHLSLSLSNLDVLEVIPTDTHYFLVKMKHHKASQVKEWLVKQHGILVRDASTFPLLSEYHLRIATQNLSHNALLINALSQLPGTL